MAGPGAGPEAEKEVTAAELGGGGSRHVSSGRTGVGVHAVSAEKVDTHVRVAGARADLLGIVGGECFREEHPPVLA